MLAPKWVTITYQKHTSHENTCMHSYTDRVTNIKCDAIYCIFYIIRTIKIAKFIIHKNRIILYTNKLDKKIALSIEYHHITIH